MVERKEALAGIVRAVADARMADLEGVVKAAYTAGAHREELLCAVELGGSLGAASHGVLPEAYGVVHTWSWMAARRRTGDRLPIEDCRLPIVENRRGAGVRGRGGEFGLTSLPPVVWRIDYCRLQIEDCRLPICDLSAGSVAGLSAAPVADPPSAGATSVSSICGSSTPSPLPSPRSDSTLRLASGQLRRRRGRENVRAWQVKLFPEWGREVPAEARLALGLPR